MDQKAKEVLDFTINLFLTYGFKSITMDEIATAQGISKKTLYQYVENKNDLVKKAISHFIEKQKKETLEIQAENLNAIDEILKIYNRTCLNLQEMNPNAGHELQKHYPEAWNIFLDYKSNFIYQNVLENFDKGISEGLYRTDFDKKIIATYYVARIDIFMDKNLFSPQEYSYKTILMELFKYHIRGVGSDKGIKYLENHVDLNF